MSYERFGGEPLDYQLCSYDGSRLNFRGPMREPKEPYVAVLGGTSTFGKYVARPYPERLEDALALPCVNLGVPGAGIDAFAGDLGAQVLSAKADLVVMEVLSAHHMSNRFYTVHPRRNDRFLHASRAMQALFRGVDFTQFHFVGHMLRTLAQDHPDGFLILMQEMRTAWVSRMRLLVDRLRSPVVLFWLSDHLPDEKRGLTHIASAPFGVTSQMLDALRGEVSDIAYCRASPAALARGCEGMIFPEQERQAALQLFGPAVHQEAADALSTLLERRLL